MGNSGPNGVAEPLGQRRQVSILSADLAGYTPLAERLGEERTFEVIRPIIKTIVDAVEDNNGRVEHIAGDGVLAVFGAPEALEDSPFWACSAALEIQAKLSALADDFLAAHGVRPLLRVGVHTGPAVLGHIGSDGRSEIRTVGDTVNLAARLQSAAQPGYVVISEATQILVGARIECEALGLTALKGKAATSAPID